MQMNCFFMGVRIYITKYLLRMQQLPSFEFQGVTFVFLASCTQLYKPHMLCILKCIFVKRFYMASDSTQNGIHGKKVMTSLWPTGGMQVSNRD